MEFAGIVLTASGWRALRGEMSENEFQKKKRSFTTVSARHPDHVNFNAIRKSATAINYESHSPDPRAQFANVGRRRNTGGGGGSTTSE